MSVKRMIYTVGVVCSDENTMKHPFLYTSEFVCETFDEAREKLLKESFVSKARLNDDVCLVEVGYE